MSNSGPNVLIIHADQHRYDCLGCMGNKDIITPNIDKLAEEGALFTHCFSTFPVCTPARYSLITGLYVHQHLGWTNRSTLPSGIPTFPKILKEMGYKTKAVGKMHYTPTYLDVGFEEMVLSEQDGPGRYDDDYHRELMEKGLIDYIDMRDQVALFRNQAPDEYHENFGTESTILGEENFNTGWVGNKALKSLVNWKETESNLLMVGFIKPHHPFDVPQSWVDKYDPEKLTLLPGWTEECQKIDLKFNVGFFDNTKLTPEKMKVIMAKYYASITQIDHYVGQMVNILKDKGLYDNTLIIYTSDHGDYVGYHHLTLKGNYMYDPVIRVPLVVKYPTDSENELVEGGKKIDGLVSIVDIFATVVDEAGGYIPPAVWESVQPLDEDLDRDAVYAETDGGNYMVRTQKYKLLLCNKNTSQFFDLEEDPYELNNLYGEPSYSEQIRDLKDKLFNWLAFEARTHINQDHRAQIIKGDNVPEFDDGHVEEIQKYLEGKMKKFTDERNN